MTEIDKLLLQLESDNPNKRYEACEELRVAPSIPDEAISALRKATDDPSNDVADAAQRALETHTIQANEISQTEITEAEEESAANPPEKKKGLLACIVVIIIVVIFSCIVVIAMIFGGLGGDDTPDTGDNIGASIICEKFLEDRLKAPSTAKYAPYGDQKISSLGNEEFKVISYVDAENSFGAMIRTDYICVVRYTGDDNWRLIELQTTP